MGAAMVLPMKLQKRKRKENMIKIKIIMRMGTPIGLMIILKMFMTSPTMI